MTKKVCWCVILLCCLMGITARSEVVFSDGFDRADSPRTLGAGWGNGATTDYAPGIKNNRLWWETTGWNVCARAYLDNTSGTKLLNFKADYDLVTTMTSMSRYLTFNFRMPYVGGGVEDGGTAAGYMVGVRQTSATTVQIILGSDYMTSINVAGIATTGLGCHMTILAVNDTIKVYVDGVEKISYTDSTANAGKTTAGYMSFSIGNAPVAAGMDNLAIDDLIPVTVDPDFSLSQNSNGTETSVTISSVTQGANIYYAVNGAIPSVSDTAYPSPATIVVPNGTIIRAIAKADGYKVSSTKICESFGTYVNDDFSESSLDSGVWADSAAVLGQKVTNSDVSGNGATGAAEGWVLIDGWASPVTLNSILKVHPEDKQVAVVSTTGTQWITWGKSSKWGFDNIYIENIEQSAKLIMVIGSQTKQLVFKTPGYSGYSPIPLAIHWSQDRVWITSGTRVLFDTNSDLPDGGGIWSIPNGSEQGILTYNWYQGAISFDDMKMEIVPEQAAAPVISPSVMTISGPTTVTITSPTPNAHLYYTINGEVPTTSSNECTSSIVVTPGTTLKAIAVAAQYGVSPVVARCFSAPTIPIVAWVGCPPLDSTPARFQEMKEAGFTHNLQHYYLPYQTFHDVQSALEAAEEVGIKMFICPIDPQSPNVEPFTTENYIATFKDYAAVEGYFMKDEPSAENFASLAESVNTIQTQDPNHWCYINLFANYNYTYEQYQSYVGSYLDTVPVKVLSYDNYPILSTGVRSNYYENLEIISAAAKAKGIPFWGFALSSPHGSYPTPTLTHLRYQMFSNLAYGAQGLQYFTYAIDEYGFDFDSGPIDANGAKTPIYYVVQSMNNEIKGLSPIFLGASVIRVGHTGASIPSGTTRYTPISPITNLSTEGSDGALVSELTNGDKEYLVVMNRDIANPMTLTISVDTTKAISRVNKDGSQAALAGGTVVYTVDPADIIILQWSTLPMPGDANGDGAVDVGDLGILAANYGKTSGATWAMGDFNGDGAVDVGDLGILAANYGKGVSSGSNFDADYAKVFGTAENKALDNNEEETTSPLCGSLGLSLIAGLVLMCLMMGKLKE